MNPKHHLEETDQDSEFCSHRGCTNCSPAHAAESPSTHSLITPPRPNLTDAVSQRKPHRLRVGVIASAPDILAKMSDVFKYSDEFQPCDSFSTASAAIRANIHIGANILVLQLDLPDLCGIHCAAELLKRKPELQAIMASFLKNPTFIERACARGIHHWLLRPFSLGQCLATMRLASSQIRLARPYLGVLTSREDDFIRCLARGQLYKEIEEQLHLSHTSLRKLQHSAYAKLHARKAAEAVSAWRGLQGAER